MQDSDQVTRVVKLSDDLARTITFPNWYWRNLDFLCREGHVEYEFIVDHLWQKAVEVGDDVPADFRMLLGLFIFHHMRDLDPEITMQANDNRGAVSETAV